VIVGTAKLNRQLLTFDVSKFDKARTNRDKIATSLFDRAKTKDSNRRHRSLLRPRRKRPRGHAPDKADKRPPLHGNLWIGSAIVTVHLDIWKTAGLSE